uniref:Uncharacterized protein n=1 Tax=Oryza sativa subsp. japonica TaxID=39947 RepID=Q2QUT1_ORYSJ|nr:hypothetical protein LOC_Os12g15206 [Oryza sativa Japonica Group]
MAENPLLKGKMCALLGQEPFLRCNALFKNCNN